MNPPSDDGSFDFIVVGAGAAGCLLANRLSADPRHRVLLLEAGGPDASPWFRIPVGYRHTIGNPRYDWCFDGEPEPGLNHRVIRHTRGKVLGGSTAINGMVAIRGQAADYDGWRALGLPGWGYDELLPFFKRSEDHVLGASAVHGAGGEWRVDAARVHWPIQDDVHAAAVQAGIRAVDDFNRGDNEGVGPIHVNQKGGRRWSAADAFLAPVRGRSNLRVVTNALAERINFSGRRAAGIEWRDDAGGLHLAPASHSVVLAAGAIGSPHLLLRSGVGPAGHLAEQGIATVVDLPGVGENLHDHLQVALRFRLEGAATLNRLMNSRLAQALIAMQYALTRRGPLSMAPCQLGLFARSSPGVERADLGFNVLPFSREAFGAKFDPFPGLTLIVYDLRPSSRGQLRLGGPDAATSAAQPPRLLMNYLQTERDRNVIVDAIRLTRRIVGGDALARYKPVELWPGSSVGSGSGSTMASTAPGTHRDEDFNVLLQAARARAGSIWHPVGSARMGPDGDPLAVLDAQLRVRGVEGLRVIDASVMPHIVSGNTASPTVMIAEKGASLLLAAAR